MPLLAARPGLKLLFIEPNDFPQTDRLRCREPERPDHLLLVEAEQLAGRRRRAEHPGGAGDVPADVVVIGIDRVADPAFGFDAEHQRVEKILARHRLHLRQRQDRRGDRAGRMDDGFQMGVVIVEDVARHAVDESGIHDVKALPAAEQRSLMRPRERRERRRRDVHRLVVRAADGDAHPVEQGPHAFLADVFRQVVIFGGDHVMGEDPGHVRRRGSGGRLLRLGRWSPERTPRRMLPLREREGSRRRAKSSCGQ